VGALAVLGLSWQACARSTSSTCNTKTSTSSQEIHHQLLRAISRLTAQPIAWTPSIQ
jgi:hypothetical protein